MTETHLDRTDTVAIVIVCVEKCLVPTGEGGAGVSTGGFGPASSGFAGGF